MVEVLPKTPPDIVYLLLINRIILYPAEQPSLSCDFEDD
jgi:hypothetical protein